VFAVTSSAGAVMAVTEFATAASVAELLDTDPRWRWSGLPVAGLRAATGPCEVQVGSIEQVDGWAIALRIYRIGVVPQHGAGGGVEQVQAARAGQ
jgi:hypothetical protein